MVFDGTADMLLVSGISCHMLPTALMSSGRQTAID